MVHVLIGFAEALPAPEVVFSLLSAGHRVSVFARSDRLPLARLPLKGLHVLPPFDANTEAAKTALAQAMDKSGADALLPLDDAGLWLAHAALPGDGRIAGAGWTAAGIALDKSAQIRAATSAGLAVPPTVTWDGYPQAVPESLTFPAIAKPGLAMKEVAGGLAKGDATYLADTAAAESFFGETETENAPWLIQPLIAGRGEGVFGFVTGAGNVTAWSGHRRMRMMNPHGSGASACEAAPPAAGLKEQVAAFLEAIDWRGPFMVELLRDAEGTPWFMELNGRMWGSMALARRQGFEYPAWAVSQVETPDFMPRSPEPAPMMVRHLGREILHLAFVVRGPKSAFHRAGWPRLHQSLPGVLRPGSGRGFYNYDPAFPRYFLRDALWTVKKAFRR